MAVITSGVTILHGGGELPKAAFSLCLFAVELHEATNEQELFGQLMQNYNKYARPVQNHSDSIQVVFTLTLNAVEDLVSLYSSIVMLSMYIHACHIALTTTILPCSCSICHDQGRLSIFVLWFKGREAAAAHHQRLDLYGKLP